MIYTVIGVYEHNNYQRYAQDFDAETPLEAEQACRREVAKETDPDNLIIAGVALGPVEMVA